MGLRAARRVALLAVYMCAFSSQFAVAMFKKTGLCKPSLFRFFVLLAADGPMTAGGLLRVLHSL
jgi:hypothetical protein